MILFYFYQQVGGQNLVGSPMIPASVQIVNMRPGTPTTTQIQQKSVATVQPTRVLIGGSQNSGVSKFLLLILIIICLISKKKKI